MRIGIVLSKPPSYSETFFNNKIKGLLDNGIQVYLFVQDNSNNYKTCKVVSAPKVYRKKIPMAFSAIKVAIGLLPYVKRLFRFIKWEKQTNRNNWQIAKNIYNNAHILKANLDWLHFGFATMAIQSENIAKTINAQMAVSVRGFDIDVHPLKHDEPYKQLWNNCDKLHAISEYTLQRALNLGYEERNNVKIIYPAIDTKRFGEIKDKDIGNKERVTLTTVGRLHWIKGYLEVLESLLLLKNENVNFQYNIIGAGDFHAELVFAIHQYGLQKEVKLLGKKLPEEIKEVLSSTDIYIQYSYSEGFCNAVLEAQAMGCLCIVSDGGGLSENVLHGQTGWVVPKRNPKALAEKIREVINLPVHEKYKIATKARKRVKSQFNLDKHNRAWLDFYQKD
jgi:colanic acid/amylovoran biosynthesis glycosyltransferase